MARFTYLSYATEHLTGTLVSKYRKLNKSQQSHRRGTHQKQSRVQQGQLRTKTHTAYNKLEPQSKPAFGS